MVLSAISLSFETRGNSATWPMVDDLHPGARTDGTPSTWFPEMIEIR